MTKILIIEDEKKTADLIERYLLQQEYETVLASDGPTGLALARSAEPALIVLDLMLPHGDGIEICRILRRESAVPIIILTARSTEEDVLYGLEVGADDYITKPFSPRELIARIKTVLRRTNDGEQNDRIVSGELVIDLTRHEVTIADELIHLTPKEFKLLETMASQPGKAFSRVELVRRAFGYNYEGLERTVDAHIMNLRKKIEQDASHPHYVVTVYGVGYRFSNRTG